MVVVVVLRIVKKQKVSFLCLTSLRRLVLFLFDVFLVEKVSMNQGGK